MSLYDCERCWEINCTCGFDKLSEEEKRAWRIGQQVEIKLAKQSPEYLAFVKKHGPHPDMVRLNETYKKFWEEHESVTQ